jgi:hypothetical protein
MLSYIQSLLIHLPQDLSFRNAGCQDLIAVKQYLAEKLYEGDPAEEKQRARAYLNELS